VIGEEGSARKKERLSKKRRGIDPRVRREGRVERESRVERERKGFLSGDAKWGCPIAGRHR